MRAGLRARLGSAQDSAPVPSTPRQSRRLTVPGRLWGGDVGTRLAVSGAGRQRGPGRAGPRGAAGAGRRFPSSPPPRCSARAGAPLGDAASAGNFHQVGACWKSSLEHSPPARHATPRGTVLPCRAEPSGAPAPLPALARRSPAAPAGLGRSACTSRRPGAAIRWTRSHSGRGGARAPDRARPVAGLICLPFSCLHRYCSARIPPPALPASHLPCVLSSYKRHSFFPSVQLLSEQESLLLYKLLCLILCLHFSSHVRLHPFSMHEQLSLPQTCHTDRGALGSPSSLPVSPQ